MLLPTTLPNAMSTWPDQALWTETAISGRAGAEGHDGEPDHQGRDAEAERQLAGAAHEQLGSADQGSEAAGQHQEDFHGLSGSPRAVACF